MPPMGYAVVLARRQKTLAHLSNVQAWQALLPYGLCVGAVLFAVFLNPAWVHAFRQGAGLTDMNTIHIGGGWHRWLILCFGLRSSRCQHSVV
jgi:hypothetical protein